MDRESEYYDLEDNFIGDLSGECEYRLIEDWSFEKEDLFANTDHMDKKKGSE